MGNQSAAKQNNSLKLLIVDDDQSSLDLVGESLSGLGFDLLRARDATEAFNLIQMNSARLALVVSDFNMPGETGFDLRKKMLPDLVDIPFVIVSGFVSREEALRAIDLKISAFLEKPFQIKALKELIKKESDSRVTTLREEDELLAGFLEEARTLLDEMESIVLTFDGRAAEPDAINRLFACAHTIKGTSGYFKPDTTNRFTHKFEDFIVKFRGTGVAIDPVSSQTMLGAIDVIRQLLDCLENYRKPPELKELIEIFNYVVPTTTAEAAPAQPNVAVKQEPKVDELKVSVALLNSFMERSGELTVLRNMVNKTLRLIEQDHAQDPNVAILSTLLNEMHKTNAIMQDEMSDLRKVSIRHIVKPLSRTVHDLSAQLKKKMKLEVKGEDLRVDHSVADVLSKCLIHIVRNSADHGLEGPDDRLGKGKPAVGTITLSAEQSNDMYKVTVADDGRGINYERVVKKAIENGLATADEISRMPRSQVLNFIFAPGFSTATVVTDVSGRGVGTDMVKRSVEEIGGHIVIESETDRGSSFTLHLPVPKSVMIVNSLLVQTNQNTYAIPQSSVRRVLRIEASDKRLQLIQDERFFAHDDGLLPLIRLTDVLQLPLAESSQTESPAITKIVWVETKAGELGVEVDEILDVEDTVVKKVAHWIDALQVYAGATFLADGRAGLVLDVEGIARKAAASSAVPTRTKKREELEQLEKTEQQAERLSLLTFDVGTKTNYAVEQAELFRLEEISTEELQFVGQTTVVLYRGSTMRLLTIDGQNPVRDSRANWPIVVVKIEDTLIGFVVNKIGGFAELLKTDQSRSQYGSIVIVENRAVTLVNLTEIATRVTQASESLSQSA